MSQHPLILTLTIEPARFNYFNSLRQKHFPSHRNFIDAHLTLFHALPYIDSVISDIRELSNTYSPFVLNVIEPISIGKGVAFKIESNKLMQLHKSLQDKWNVYLTAQDKQKLWPHITVQNKVPVQQAKDLLVELKDNFNPFSMDALGLQVWEYLNGPWKLIEQFNFKKSEQ